MDNKISEYEFKIQDLKLISMCPQLYLSDFFLNLRTKIDYYYQSTLDINNNISIGTNNNNILENLINQLYTIESEWIRSIQKTKNSQTIVYQTLFESDIRNLEKILKKIRNCDQVNQLMKKNCKIDLDKKINHIRLNIEEKIFDNKTIFIDSKYQIILVKNAFFQTNVQNCSLFESLFLSKKQLENDQYQSIQIVDFETINDLNCQCKFLIFSIKLFANFSKYLKNLESCDFKYNYINKLYSDTFVGMNNLTLLNLSRNRIRHIEANTFLSLSKLNSLNLQYNLIYTLKNNTFLSLINLNELNLNDNRLSKIHRLFSGLYNLEILNLRFNYLSQLDKNSFHGLYKIKYLDLKLNKINKIAFDTFQGKNFFLNFFNSIFSLYLFAKRVLMF